MTDLSAVSPDFRTQAGICFATHSGVALHGDLYLPVKTGRVPIVIGLPGGGWRVGSRAQVADWGRHLAQRGYGCFAIDYRHTTMGKMFPEAVNDVVAAMRFVAAHADDWQVDATRMVMMGSSAGAHLAALASLAAERFDPSPGAPGLPRVAGMVLAYGVYDLARQWQHGLGLNQAEGEDRQARFLGADPYEDPDLYHLASPIRHVTYRRNYIKSMVIWGDQDEVVPCSQSLEFLVALQQARFRVRSCAVMGAGHFWFNEEPIAEPGSHSGFVAPRVLRFLRDSFPAQEK